MTREELQLIADTAWVILGPDGFGVVVTDEPLVGGYRIDVTGFENGTVFNFSETVSRLEVEQMLGDLRYNYIRVVAARLRKAITDLRMCQIQMSLGE